MENSAEHVVLKCINALELVEESCPSIKHLVDGKIYSRLISFLKNENIVGEDLTTLIPRLEALFQDHFVGDLIVFEEAVAGNCVELTKLTLLLLYITLFTEAKLRSRLLNSSFLDQATQAKFKYLLEAVQKRGSAVNSRFLHILCTEKLDIRSILQCQSPVNGGGVGSPRVYTTSPKSSITSPLRELVQSPQFRLQEILNAKKQLVKRLQQQVMALEGEKQDMTLTLDAANHRITKLREEVDQLQVKLQASQQEQDESQAQMVAGDNLRQQQVSQLAVKCSQLQRENVTLQQTVERLTEEKDELTAKNSSLHQHLLLVRAEKDRLHEDVLSLNQAKCENESLIESQASVMQEMKSQLEELQCLMQNKSLGISVEESFGSISPSHYTAITSPGSSGGENMAEAVVEKILWEHKEELQQLQHQHTALQQEFDKATAQRQNLLDQVATYKEEKKDLVEEVRQKTSTLCSLMQELNAANEAVATVTREKLEFATNLQDKEILIEELKEEINKINQQMNEEKAAFDNQVKMMETDSLNVQMKMEADLQLLAKDKARENEEKEGLLALIQKDKENLLQLHAKEKCELMEVVEENKKSLETLQQKFENLTSQYASEKDKLTSDLKYSQESYSELKKQYGEIMENLNAKTAEQTLTLKEKLIEIAALTEKMENMKAVNVDLVNKHEAEVHRLSISLEAEKQCVVEVRKDMGDLLNTRKKHIESIERLQGSNEELVREITELKDDLGKMNEKYSMLQQQSEEAAEHYKNDVSELQEKITKQEEVHVDLLRTVETNKQECEKEKLTITTNLQEKEKCVEELKEEINRIRNKLSKEKAVLDSQMKIMEKDSLSIQMKMKSDLQLLTEEKARENEEKEGLLIALQKNERLLQKHVEEKCELVNAVEEKKKSLETLQEKFENLTSQYVSEKDKLTSDLKYLQESYSELMKEYDEAKEKQDTEVNVQALTLQEKLNEIATLKKEIESMKIVNVELVRKYENEILCLSVSLEAEKQCVAEVRKDMGDLMDTRTKYSENMERMRGSNEELVQEIAELKYDLVKMNEKYSLLQQQSDEAAQHYKNVVSGLQEKLTKQEEVHVDLLRIVETNKQESIKEKLTFATSLQEKEKCIEELKKEINKTREQMNEDKAANDTHIKMIEKDSLNVRMKIESDLLLLTDEKARENEEKEGLLATMQKDKENLLQLHAQEKCELIKAVEENKKYLDTLQQKYENLTIHYASEKDKLTSDLKYSQESCSKLMKEYDELKENLNKKIAEEALTLQEKLNEIATLKEEMRSMKAVNIDLVRKYETEVQSLSVSLEAEKQCVVEVRKDMSDLMDTRTKYSENIELLRGSNEELVKEITELKGDLGKMNEKYTMLWQQSEDAARHYKNEVSGLQEKLTKQEVHVDLLRKMETSKQEHEKEKLTIATNLQEKERCIEELKEEINKTRNQMTNEKAAFDTHIKMMEKESLTVQMKMKSDLQLLTEGKAKENEEKEDLLAALQKKDNQLQIHAEEKCELVNAVEEKKKSLEMLQEKFENLKSQYVSEKDKLTSDIQLDLEVTEIKEIENLRESIQELSEGFTKLKGYMIERDNKCLMVQQQIEEVVQLCKNKSSTGDYLKKQEENHLALVSETEKKQQLYEEEKSALVNNMREKDKLILQLQEAIKQMKSKMREERGLLKQHIGRSSQSLEQDNNVIEKDKVILELEEIKQLRGKMSEGKGLLDEQMDRSRQTLDQEQLMMSNSAEERLRNQRQAVSTKEKVQEQPLRQSTEITSLMHQQEELVASFNQKLIARKAETEKQRIHIHALESKLIDKEQELATAKEEQMRVEREAEKSCYSLKEELQATKEDLKLEKRTSDRIRMTYKTEVEKLTLQIEEWDREKKERDVLFKKYETAKKKLAEIVSSLDEARTTNRHYQQQLSQCKEYIKKLEEKAQKEKEAENRLLQIENKYQPVKEKLQDCENTIRRLNTEKRSLEMQLKHAESQLQEQKKIQRRESFWEQDTQRLTHPSVSGSQVQRGAGRRLTTTSSSSSNEEYWGINDSTEKLIPKKISRTQGQSVSQSSVKDTVFRKPGSRVKAAASVGEGGQQREVPPVTRSKGQEPPAPPPEIMISDTSLGKSIPKSMHFRCDEEEEELFNNKYLHDMKVGKWHPDGDESWRRLSELQRRNSLYPPHMRSAYPVEMQFRPLGDFEDDKLREGCAVDDRQLMNLTQATENLELDSPAFNLRKRKSPSDSTYSETSLDSSEGKRTRRLSTSYSRPGPPTPGRRFSRGDKENRRESSASELSLSLWQQHKKEGVHVTGSRGCSPVSHQPQPESSRVTRRRQLRHTASSSSVQSQSSSPARSPSVLSKKGMTTPRGRKGMTPSSLRKILAKGKSPWRKLENSETPKGLGDTTNSNGSSKLRIFRKPFGSRNYNVLSASLRSQENPISFDNSLASSTGMTGNTSEPRTRRKSETRQQRGGDD